MDRCAAEYPELAKVWFGQDRGALLAQLTTYLEGGIRLRRFRAVPDPAVTARLAMETLVFWAVHRHWDPGPQRADPLAVEETIVQMLVDALAERTRPAGTHLPPAAGARAPEECPVSLYSQHILPVLTDLAMRNEAARAERARWVPLAAGVVLEIGAGSGLNFGHYARSVSRLYALEPSEELRRMAARRAQRAPCPVEFVAASAEAIPLTDESVDTVVTTWTLCTIAEVGRALHEIRRVLCRDGRLIFVEHGRSTDPRVVRWQDRLTPVRRRVAGGCHLNRPIEALIAAGGFDFAELKRSYSAGPRVGAYLYRGVARVDAPGARHLRA